MNDHGRRAGAGDARAESGRDGLFDRAAVGLLYLDANGRVRAANARLADWLGCAAEDLDGRSLAECVPEDARKALRDALARAGASEVTLDLALAAPSDRGGAALACTVVLAPDPDGRLATVQRREPGDSAARVYEQTFTANTAPKLLIDPEDGAIVDANPAAEAFYGYSVARLKAMHIHEINTLSAAEVRAEMARAAREERRFFRFRHRVCGGDVRDVEVYSGPVVLDGRRYLYSIIHDVSETRRYERELEFYGVAFGRLPVGVYRNTPGPEGRFVRLNPAMVELFEAATETELRSTPVRELYRDPAERTALSRDLAAYGRVVGREVDLKTLRGRPFRARITAYRTEDADGQCVFEGVIEDITEPRAAETFQTRLLANLAEGVFGLDRYGRYSFLNPAACRLLGFESEGDALGRDAHSANHHLLADGSVYPPEACPIHHVLETGKPLEAWDDHFVRTDGTRLPVSVFCAPTFDVAGRVDGAVVSFQDQTARREREAHLNKATSHLPGAIYQYRVFADGRHEFPFISEGAQLVFGLSPDRIQQDADAAFARVNSEDFPRIQVSIDESARELAPWRERFRLRHPVRGTIWVEGRATPEASRADGSIVWHGVMIDISEQVAMEDALRASEARFRQLAGSVNEVFWLQDADAILYVNPAYERVWGYSRERLYQDPVAMLEAVHPDDRPRVEAVFLTADFGDGTADETFRIRRPDGEERWVRVRRYPITDADGRVARVAGTAVDITALKATQEALERNQAELERQAFFDRLTGVANRRYFETLLDREFLRAERYGHVFSLLMFDLDHFKNVNDTWGHAAGDVVLQHVTRVAGERLRASDVLGRWGGEEFMVLLPGDDAEAGARVAESIRARVAEYAFPEVGRVTISLGVAAFTFGEPRSDLLRRVDEVLYRAKREGRNRVAIADPPAGSVVRTGDEPDGA